MTECFCEYRGYASPKLPDDNALRLRTEHIVAIGDSKRCEKGVEIADCHIDAVLGERVDIAD